ncbi:hypothetical protein ABT112_23550 [Streptomyces sp. NPDC002055]|uniref:hypothetical protein n=1 Tax=Streptomyces sp. NPDC002055 TaxID=3154534 RepID=UPI003333B89E
MLADWARRWRAFPPRHTLGGSKLQSVELLQVGGCLRVSLPLGDLKPLPSVACVASGQRDLPERGHGPVLMLVELNGVQQPFFSGPHVAAGDGHHPQAVICLGLVPRHYGESSVEIRGFIEPPVMEQSVGPAADLVELFMAGRRRGAAGRIRRRARHGDHSPQPKPAAGGPGDPPSGGPAA